MKTTFLLTLFLVFAFMPSAKADLVDTDGDPIRNGGSYYIFPALWDAAAPSASAAKDFIMEFIVESPPNCAATPARWTIVGGEDETKQVKLEEYEPEDTIMSTSTRGRENNRPLVIADDDDDPFVVVFRKVESPAD
ncbi:chymotrypsin inhibitor 3-like [Prosopis cineraria]|uniref:chymotrypsin inhibitor 3-like n=1 Tax=Prosopis cineraria TaxID=364024 RepID=UPI00240F75AD|nr:chymotrypsin inhibitor 3-like [Prosopis cineraria]